MARNVSRRDTRSQPRLLARVAPQLNLFAVGFPMAIMVGLGVLFLLLPYIQNPLVNALEHSLAVMTR